MMGKWWQQRWSRYDKSNGNSDGVNYGSTCMGKPKNRRENGGGTDSKIVYKNGGVSDAGNDGGVLENQ